MKDFEYYSSVKAKYPKKKDYTIYYAYDKGECLGSYRANIFAISCIKKLHPDAIIQESYDQDSYNEAMKLYRESKNLIFKEFKKDLFEEFGVENNPKKDKCFALAWEYGHSYGYESVYNCFSDLVGLIEE